MFEFPEILASKNPRPRQFSDGMELGAIFQFAMFIDSFQRRIAISDVYEILPFFRTSLARRAILYSIMSNYLRGEKLNVSGECSAKGIDYSNAMRTLKDAQKRGYINKNYEPSEEMQKEFFDGIKDAVADTRLQHLAASIVCSQVIGKVADQIEEDGLEP